MYIRFWPPFQSCFTSPSVHVRLILVYIRLTNIQTCFTIYSHTSHIVLMFWRLIQLFQFCELHQNSDLSITSVVFDSIYLSFIYMY